MKNYRVKPYFYKTLGTTRFVVEKRDLLIFWIHIKDFMLKEDADKLCDELNKKDG